MEKRARRGGGVGGEERAAGVLHALLAQPGCSAMIASLAAPSSPK